MSENVRKAIELNEYHTGAWLPFLTILIYIIILKFRNPTNLSKLELYVTSLFSLYLSIITDYFLGMTFKFYEYYDSGGDIWTPITVIPLYVLTNILFLNFYPYKSSRIKQFTYIILWSIYATVWEWFAVNYTTFFEYNSWHIGYSALIYPLLYVTLLGNLKVVKTLNNTP